MGLMFRLSQTLVVKKTFKRFGPQIGSMVPHCVRPRPGERRREQGDTVSRHQELRCAQRVRLLNAQLQIKCYFHKMGERAKRRRGEMTRVRSWFRPRGRPGRRSRQHAFTHQTSLVAHTCCCVHWFAIAGNVSTAFLHALLTDEVFLIPPVE